MHACICYMYMHVMVFWTMKHMHVLTKDMHTMCEICMESCGSLTVGMGIPYVGMCLQLSVS